MAAADPAKYLDGEPQNLPAAASDALEWLRFLQGYLQKNRLPRDHEANALRLDSSIRSLEQFLPKLPAEFSVSDSDGGDQYDEEAA